MGNGKWTPEEDELLLQGVGVHGESWAAIAEEVPGRTRKQCRDRWLVHSRSQNHSPMSTAEQVRFIDLHRRFGTQWRRIAEHMPDRSEQHLKNLFATRRRAKSAGAELLLHDYARGGPAHTLLGLDAPLVLGTLAGIRDPVDETQWSHDVRVWWDVSMEAGGHVYVGEVPMDPPMRHAEAEADLRLAMEVYHVATATVGAHAVRLMLATAAPYAFVGLAHPDEATALALAQMTVRTWQLERRLQHSGVPGEHRIVRRTTI